MPQAEIELKAAEAKVYESELNVAVQRRIIQRLATRGLSTAIAQQELKRLEEALRIHSEHLERLQASQRGDTSCRTAAGLTQRKL